MQNFNIAMAGLVAFALFFYSLAQNLGYWVYVVAGLGLLASALLSAVNASEKLSKGVFAALLFAAPVAIFSVLSVGDLVLLGKGGPFMFWLSATGLTVASGLLGVGITLLYRIMIGK